MAKKTIKKTTKLADIIRLVTDKQLTTVGFISLEIMGADALTTIAKLNEMGVVVAIGGKAQGRPEGRMTAEEITEKYDEIAAAICHAEYADSVRSIAANFNVSPTTVQMVRNALMDIGYELEDDDWEKNLKYVQKHYWVVEQIMRHTYYDSDNTDTVSPTTLDKIRTAMTKLGYVLSKPMNEQTEEVRDTFDMFSWDNHEGP